MTSLHVFGSDIELSPTGNRPSCLLCIPALSSSQNLFQKFYDILVAYNLAIRLHILTVQKESEEKVNLLSNDYL